MITAKNKSSQTEKSPEALFSLGQSTGRVLVGLEGTPEHIVAIEDSPTGTEAALAAGLHCIAFATPFTEKQLRTDSPLDDRWIVSDPHQLLDTVDALFEEENF